MVLCLPEQSLGRDQTRSRADRISCENIRIELNAQARRRRDLHKAIPNRHALPRKLYIDRCLGHAVLLEERVFEDGIEVEGRSLDNSAFPSVRHASSTGGV